MSPHGIIEYDGVYFWIGVDRFLAYDGTVKEIPNKQNFNWFFDNVNINARTKVWATKIPRFGEIWWFFPFGDSEECTHAIILNVREQVWYDTILPRSAGFYSQVFRYPVMYGSAPNTSNLFDTFVHEFRRDAVFGGDQHAIPSNFETNDFGLPTGGLAHNATSNNAWTYLDRVEPDFVLDGTMLMSVTGNRFAQSPVETFGPFPITASTEKVDIRVQLRNMRLKFELNDSNSHFEMGRLMLHTKPGDPRS